MFCGSFSSAAQLAATKTQNLTAVISHYLFISTVSNISNGLKRPNDLFYRLVRNTTSLKKKISESPHVKEKRDSGKKFKFSEPSSFKRNLSNEMSSSDLSVPEKSAAALNKLSLPTKFSKSPTKSQGWKFR